MNNKINKIKTTWKNKLNRLNPQIQSKLEPNPCLSLNTENLPGEIWKDIKDYEGLYQVSSCGRVKCINAEHIEKYHSTE